MEGTIDVDNVLTAMAEAGDGKIRFKLPKVLNKATGKNTSTTFNFSWPNWGADSLAYRDSIAKRGSAWLCDTVLRPCPTPGLVRLLRSHRSTIAQLRSLSLTPVTVALITLR